MVSDDTVGRKGEGDGAVAVRLKVDSTIEFGRRMVEVFDTSRSAYDRETEGLGDIGCRGPVRIGGLHNADPEIGQTGGFDKVCDEGSGKSSNLVPIKKAECAVRVAEIVNNSVGITIK